MIIGLPVLSELENDKYTFNFYFPYLMQDTAVVSRHFCWADADTKVEPVCDSISLLRWHLIIFSIHFLISYPPLHSVHKKIEVKTISFLKWPVTSQIFEVTESVTDQKVELHHIDEEYICHS